MRKFILDTDWWTDCDDAVAIRLLCNAHIKKEIELLPLSALILTYECGIRFLSDYLDGDTYFKIHYPDQNLVRAKNHLKLCQDIHSKLDEMKKIVEKYI